MILSVIVLLAIILGFALLWGTISAFLIRNHSAHYFAFRSFRTLKFFAIALLGYLAGANYFLKLAVSTANKLLDADLPTPELSVSDKVFACAVLGILAASAVALLKALAVATNKPTSAIAAHSSNTAPSIAQTPKRSIDLNASRVVPDIVPWHKSAIELLQVCRPSIAPSSSGKWYPDKSLFLDESEASSGAVAVYCAQVTPTLEDVSDALAFVRSRSGASVRRLIVAVEIESSPELDFGVVAPEFDFVTKDSLLNELVSAPHYFKYLHERWTGARILDASDLSLDSIYVPSQASTKLRSANGDLIQQEVHNLEDEIMAWVREESNRHVCVLGEYGQGKSVLALKIAYEISRLVPRRLFPLLINLNGRSPRTQEPIGLLGDVAAGLSLDPNAMRLLNEHGRLVLIFDGFDEMDLVGNQVMRIQHFRTLWKFATKSKAKLLITGRPNFFLNEHEIVTAVNASEYPKEVAYSQVYNLKPFKREQIARALRCYPSSVKRRIDSVLDASGPQSRITELLMRPSTLFLAATLFGEKDASSLKKFETSAAIIERFLLHTFDRQLTKGTQFLTNEEREFFTLSIVRRMSLDSVNKVSVSSDAMRETIALAIRQLQSNPGLAEKLAGSQEVPLYDRVEAIFLVDTVFSDVRSCGIFVPDGTRFGEFRLAHKSFFEVLVALICVENYRLYCCYRSMETVSFKQRLQSLLPKSLQTLPIGLSEFLRIVDLRCYGCGPKSLLSERRRSTSAICRELLISGVATDMNSLSFAALAVHLSSDICNFSSDLLREMLADALNRIAADLDSTEETVGEAALRHLGLVSDVDLGLEHRRLTREMYDSDLVNLVEVIDVYKKFLDGEISQDQLAKLLDGSTIIELCWLFSGVDCWSIPVNAAIDGGTIDNMSLSLWMRGVEFEWRIKLLYRPLARLFRPLTFFFRRDYGKSLLVVEQLLLVGLSLCLDHGIVGRSTIFDKEGYFDWADESHLIASELVSNKNAFVTSDLRTVKEMNSDSADLDG